MTALLDSLIAQQARCYRDADWCKRPCKRCDRGKEYRAAHSGAALPETPDAAA
jgi:hypothetical protein